MRILGSMILSLVLVGCSGGVPLLERTFQTAPKVSGSSSTSGEEVVSIELAPDNQPSREGPKADFIDGTGIFINSAAELKPISEYETGETVQGLKFRDADIKTVVDAVLGNVVGAPYIIDPAVEGRITLETSGNVSTEGLLVALEDVLKVKGYALVRGDAAYRIMPAQLAPRVASLRRQPQPKSAALPGFGVYVLSPQFTAPTELQKVLAPFAPPAGILRADDTRNIIIFAGTSQELETMLQTSETFDVDWMKGMSIAFFDLDYVDADTIVSELNQILTEGGDPALATLRLIPLTRINKVLALSPRADQLKGLELWFERLDVREAGGGRRVYVYQVQNGRAEDLAASMNYILTGDASGVFGNSSFTGGDPRANSSIGSRGVFANQNQALSANRNNSNNEDEGGLAGIRILPSRENNALLILATPSEYGIIETALEQLDTPPRQVLIEASLAEVGLTDDLRFGLQWMTEFGDNQITFSQAQGGGVAQSFPGFSYLYTGSADSSAVLNALEDITDVNVISAPKLLVLNNESATLQVGDEVPIPTQSSVSTQDTNAPIVNSIQYRSTGVILTIRPRINDGGLVFLDVTQEVSDVTETISSGIDAPTINQRRVTSTIAVQSGETIALGGLIRQTDSDSKSGVPIVQRIPVLGNLFSTRSITSRKTELLVLLTPRVIEDNSDVRATMRYLEEQFDSLFVPQNQSSAVP